MSEYVVRYFFAPGVAFEHVRDNTYKWVDPVDGSFRGYVVATPIVYESTVAAQRVRRQQ